MQQYLASAIGMGSALFLAPGHFFAALLALDQGDRASALEHCQTGFALCREHGFNNWAWWFAEEMSRICAEALNAGIESEYVRYIIKLRGLQPPALDIENWPWLLKINTLGSFSALKDDQPITFSRKAPKKVIALLKAIVAFGGAEVPDRKLTDALWPDEEGDAAHDAFAVSLHRLRKLIGDDAVILKEGKVSLDPRRCWIDAFAFERRLDWAESAAASERVVRTEKALALYRGAFLAADQEESWAASARERLRAKFIRHTAFIGRHLSEEGRWQEAADCYLRGLEVDSLAEEFYQGVMRCYQHPNRRAEALAIYRRLRQTLSITLGISPSPASENLYQSLRTE